MKFSFKTIAAAVAMAAAMLVSCKPEPVATELKVSATALTFVAESPAPQTVTVTANKAWTADCSANWVTINPKSAPGDGEFTVTCSANVAPAGQSAAARSAEITVTCEEKTATVKVSQGAEGVTVSIDQTEVSVSAEAQEVTVTVTANTTFNVQIPADCDWVSDVTSKATTVTPIKLAVAANPAKEARTATVSFAGAAGETKSLTINQAGKQVTYVKLNSAEALEAFAAAVNAGESLEAFDENGDGVYELEADIDFGGKEFVMIGAGNYSSKTALSSDAKPFTGTFDGKGHTVDNFTATLAADAADGSSAGLFRLTSNAVIKDVKIGSKVVVSSTAVNAYRIGGLIGAAHDTDVINCSSSATIKGAGSQTTSGTTGKQALNGGLIGIISSNTRDCLVENCSFDGKFEVNNETNKNNGGTGFSVGGIIAYADWSVADKVVKVVNCVNNANINVVATRVAGIVASANGGTQVEDCVNNGDITAEELMADSTRPSGIVSAMGAGGNIRRCTNNGTITAIDHTADKHYGYAAGIIGQVNGDGVEIDSNKNLGDIRSDVIKETDKYIATIIVHANSKTITVKNNQCDGSVGPVNVDADNLPIASTKANFEDLISMYKSASKNSKVTWTDNFSTIEPVPAAFDLSGQFMVSNLKVLGGVGSTGLVEVKDKSWMWNSSHTKEYDNILAIKILAMTGATTASGYAYYGPGADGAYWDYVLVADKNKLGTGDADLSHNFGQLPHGLSKVVIDLAAGTATVGSVTCKVLMPGTTATVEETWASAKASLTLGEYQLGLDFKCTVMPDSSYTWDASWAYSDFERFMLRPLHYVMVFNASALH